MIIGVDATCWANGRGYGRFARELMRAMARAAPDDTFICFGDRRSFEAFPEPLPNVRRIEVRTSESPTMAAAANSFRSPTDLLRLSAAVRRERLDVFFSPSVYTYFPLPPSLRAVVTVHDTIPEQFPDLTLPTLRARLLWRAKVRLALTQARLILTVSEHSARSIAQWLRVPPSRIRVTVEAPAGAYRPQDQAAADAAARSVGLPPSAAWFVYVGGFNPHKRLDVILRAHAEVVSSGMSPHIVFVGSRSQDVFHKGELELDEIVRQAGTGHLVHWPGFVPDEQLAALLTGATALLLPSEAEGFGLPAVEAAACGTPVIATTRSPLPELLAGGGFFVDPGDAAAVARAMTRLLAEPDLRRSMGQAARERAGSMSWERSAELTLAALREAAR
jgi:glycosyltransferase involved in cell wall biosynthesis